MFTRLFFRSDTTPPDPKHGEGVIWMDHNGQLQSKTNILGAGTNNVLGGPEGSFELKEEPEDPEPGMGILWGSNGVGYGTVGNICAKVNINGTIQKKTLA